ncbi:MAG: hypothetical protein LBP76_02120 [Treponema sp.]|jgi:hypothetical protein|nr:hypothetical protein [Treponema sp.]
MKTRALLIAVIAIAAAINPIGAEPRAFIKGGMPQDFDITGVWESDGPDGTRFVFEGDRFKNYHGTWSYIEGDSFKEYYRYYMDYPPTFEGKFEIDDIGRITFYFEKYYGEDYSYERVDTYFAHLIRNENSFTGRVIGFALSDSSLLLSHSYFYPLESED